MDKHKVKMKNKEYGVLNFDNKKNRYRSKGFDGHWRARTADPTLISCMLYRLR